MKIVLLKFPLLLLCFSAANAFAQEGLPELVKRIKPSAVAIETFGAKGEKLSRGSGFFISKDRVVTNLHVIENAQRAEIHLANGTIFAVKGVIATDGEGDLALLNVEVPAYQAIPLPMDRTTPQEGESIFVIGNPFGLEGSVSNGIVSAVREIPGYGKVIQITAAISPGSSGSPVVNMRGQVIGVATLQASEGQSLNFAVPSERVFQMKPNAVQTFADISSTAKKNKRAIAERYYTQGLGFLSRDEWTKALPYFEKAAETDDDYAEAWYQAGYCYGMLNRHNDALRATKKAIELRRDWAEAYLNMGASYYALGQYKDAADSYKQANKIDPYNADSHYALALTYGKQNKTDEEILEYKRTIALRPNHTNAYERMGLAYFKQRKFNETLSAFETYRNLKGDAKSYNYLGETLIELNRLDEAKENLQQAISIDSDFEKARYNLGRAHLKAGERDAAIAQYNLLKAAESDWADKLYILIYP
jgi:tetratricopeptide (TPR) repeat protein